MTLRRSLRSGSRRTLAALALAFVVGTTGCGDGDGVTADGSAEAAVCSPVGESLEPAATKSVAVQVGEYSFTPAQVDVAAGVVTFAVTNGGTEDHELAFLPGGADVPLNPQGDPDEDALAAAGAFELEAFGPGGSCNATYDLKPGTYTLFCIVTSPDGLTHYEKGMRGRLVVA